MHGETLHQGDEWKCGIGKSVLRDHLTEAYVPKVGDPSIRPLRIFTSDPTASVHDGRVATINVPYEELKPGPRGSLFEILDIDESSGQTWKAVDLDSPHVLISNGVRPAVSNPQFHQQMVYAVAHSVYGAFRRALGRDLSWAFGRGTAGKPLRLRIRPHATRVRNAWYDREGGELCFGYFEGDANPTQRRIPKGTVYTCLSHDIVTHEMSHALLDSLRTHFSTPTGPDVLAFHEGFSDVIAVLQKFTYKDVVSAVIKKTGGNLWMRSSISDIATEFGDAVGRGSALRSAAEIYRTTSGKHIRPYDKDLPPHRLGAVLLGAIFGAFQAVYERKAEGVYRLAGYNMTKIGQEPLSHELSRALSHLASRLAQQFLTICIRALDYCPPVDIEFGDYLRALITADADLVPSDPWGYREAFIDSFRRRGIYPRNVQSLSEDALLWNPPEQEAGVLTIKIPGIATPSMCGLSPQRLRLSQARALADFIDKANHSQCRALGVSKSQETHLPPIVHSLRTCHRVGPNDELRIDIVAEVIQSRRNDSHAPGGSTLIIGTDGKIRFSIRKRVDSQQRRSDLANYRSGQGRQFWDLDLAEPAPIPQILKHLHFNGESTI